MNMQLLEVPYTLIILDHQVHPNYCTVPELVRYTRRPVLFTRNVILAKVLVGIQLPKNNASDNCKL